MSRPGLEVVATFLSPEEARIAESLLRGAGLQPVLRDGTTIETMRFYRDVVGGVKLEVPVDEAKVARQLLEAWETDSNQIEAGDREFAMSEDAQRFEGQVRSRFDEDGEWQPGPLRRGIVALGRLFVLLLLLTFVVMAVLPLVRRLLAEF